jgi:hypothetical protein
MNISRRQFLMGASAVAAVAALPTAAPVQIISGEIGRYGSVRFVEYSTVDLPNAPALTFAQLRRAVETLKANDTGDFFAVICRPGWQTELLGEWVYLA